MLWTFHAAYKTLFAFYHCVKKGVWRITSRLHVFVSPSGVWGGKGRIVALRMMGNCAGLCRFTIPDTAASVLQTSAAKAKASALCKQLGTLSSQLDACALLLQSSSEFHDLLCAQRSARAVKAPPKMALILHMTSKWLTDPEKLITFMSHEKSSISFRQRLTLYVILTF